MVFPFPLSREMGFDPGVFGRFDLASCSHTLLFFVCLFGFEWLFDSLIDLSQVMMKFVVMFLAVIIDEFELVALWKPLEPRVGWVFFLLVTFFSF